ncbi:MAG: hypothetical protein IPO81_16495 [Kouleothrix sp.]|nr:hypothetical protein [Kouleothrix sp.]
MLDILRSLAIPPAIRDAVIAVSQRRLATPTMPVGQDRAKLEQQLSRMKHLYELGDYSESEYLQRRVEIQRQIGQLTPAPSRVLDLDRAAKVLDNMGALLDAVEPDQRRALVQQVMNRIWITKGAVTAVRPAPSYMSLIEATRHM